MFSIPLRKNTDASYCFEPRRFVITGLGLLADVAGARSARDVLDLDALDVWSLSHTFMMCCVGVDDRHDFQIGPVAQRLSAARLRSVSWR